MAFVGGAVALLIGVLIFSSISDAIVCPTDPENAKVCNQAKDTAWVVIGILPVALFFALFAIFAGLDGGFDFPRIPKDRISRVIAGGSKNKIFLILKVLGLTRKKHDA